MYKHWLCKIFGHKWISTGFGHFVCKYEGFRCKRCGGMKIERVDN